MPAEYEGFYPQPIMQPTILPEQKFNFSSNMQLSIIMDVLEQNLTTFKEELVETLVTKQFLDTLEYKMTRKFNEIERVSKNMGDEVQSLKTTVTQGNLNTQELKNQVFE